MAGTVRIVANRRNPGKIPQAEEGYSQCTQIMQNEANFAVSGPKTRIIWKNEAKRSQFSGPIRSALTLRRVAGDSRHPKSPFSGVSGHPGLIADD